MHEQQATVNEIVVALFQEVRPQVAAAKLKMSA